MSAFIASGPPSRIIERAIAGDLDLVLLEPTVIELARILSDKLDFGSGRLGQTLSLLEGIATQFEPTPQEPVAPLTGDPDDDLILACADLARVEVLVSGDRRHLLPVEQHRGVRILTPQSLLAELRAS